MMTYMEAAQKLHEDQANHERRDLAGQILAAIDRLTEQERRLTELLIKINAAIDELVQREHEDDLLNSFFPDWDEDLNDRC